MGVPAIDLPAQHRALRVPLRRAIDRVIQRGDFVLGKAVREFEAAFARSCGVRYGVGVNSGTDALWLGLRSLGIGRGDEVITSAYTFFATASAIALTGARPVPVDIDPVTYNLDPHRVETSISRKTKAILAVHFAGQPADMDRLTRLARSYHLRLIEDCAQAHGARYAGRPVGSFGQVAAFSFYPTKNLSALGDGGMALTNDRALCERLRLLRDHGQQSKYRHVLLGQNSRLDAIHAAVLHVKLRRLDQWNRRRIRLAQDYHKLLQARAGGVVRLPSTRPGSHHVYHLYVIRIPSRDRVVSQLNQRGIQALVHYRVPYYRQPVFRYLGYRRDNFPIAEELAREAVSLPIYPEMRQAHVNKVVEQLVAALNRYVSSS